MTMYIVAAVDVTGNRRLVLDDIPTYDEALAVQHALVRGHDVRELVVRSADDPAWNGLQRMHDGYGRPASIAQRTYRHREIGKTVTGVLNLPQPMTWGNVVSMALESLTLRQVPASRASIEVALKTRVIIGRCRPVPHHRWVTNHGCDRAWFWPRRHGRLDEMTCKKCGGPLSQTTLAYHGTFHRLDTYTPTAA